MIPFFDKAQVEESSFDLYMSRKDVYGWKKNPLR